MPDIELKQLSLDMGKPEYDMLQGISAVENGFTNPAYDLSVGYGRVRHSSSEYLETVVGAGNLGYGIAKEYRGKGYGNILFKELLKKCKEISLERKGIKNV